MTTSFLVLCALGAGISLVVSALAVMQTRVKRKRKHRGTVRSLVIEAIHEQRKWELEHPVGYLASQRLTAIEQRAEQKLHSAKVKHPADLKDFVRALLAEGL